MIECAKLRRKSNLEIEQLNLLWQKGQADKDDFR